MKFKNARRLIAMSVLLKYSTLLLAIAAILGGGTLHAQVPQLINYQGRVIVGATNFNGTGQFKFALVNTTGSTTYWSNDGTSVNGSQPTNAVSLTVSKGLYSVLLGDTSVANMTVSIPASVFSNSDVRLRVWFNDGTTGSQLLSPDQRIASVGYAAMAANIIDGAITSAKIANGAVGLVQIDATAVQRRVTGVAPVGSFITGINQDGTVTSVAGGSGTITGVTASTGLTGGGTSGNVSLSIAAGGVNTTQLAPNAVNTSQLADSAVTAAKVGTGQVVKSLNSLKDNVTLAAGSNITITPSGNTLTLASSGGSSIWSLNGATAYYNGGNVGIGQTSATYRLEITEPNGFDLALFGPSPIIKLTDTSASNAVSTIRAFAGGIRIFNNAGSTLADFDNSGNVGFGTISPATAVEVRTATGNLGISHSDGTIRVGTYVGGSASGATGGWFGTISNNSLFFFANNGQPAMSVTADGHVHIDPIGATTSPQFEVTGGSGMAEQSINSSADRAILSLSSSGHVYTLESGLFGTPGLFGIYDRTAGKARLTIDTTGMATVGTLTITGGSDVAEPFPMEDEVVEKGAVVVIDSEHPGRLKRSTQAYDQRVAGIVSGARGIKPGIALHQEGSLEGGENVALSGRVYVQAESSNGFIEPGDLLTTSDVPGCAMKATDANRSHGAVIGKAMSSLRDKQGTVLVLVTLQ
jgi:hypothetical protein